MFSMFWFTILIILSNHSKHIGALADFEFCGNSKEKNQNTGNFAECVAEAISQCGRRCERCSLLREMEQSFRNLTEAIQEQVTSPFRPRNCLDLLQNGDNFTGIRTIYPFSLNFNRAVYVLCDQTTDGGGWTVFQHRENLQPRENFFRNWIEYRLGFGKLKGEFWLGLENLHALVSETLMEMRVDLEDYEGQKRWAKYDYFYIGTAEEKFRLDVGNYSGNAGDGMKTTHNGQMFSTPDRDNDIHDPDSCATTYKAGWWYEKCHISNLNGLPHVGNHTSYADGINWKPFAGYHYSLKKTNMALRPRIMYQ